jgi:MraZ protein
MFRGNSFHTIDAKGRFIIPTRFHEVVKASGQDFVMITQMDGCLFAYTLDEWTKVETKLLHLPKKSDAMRRFVRFFIGSAHELRCDAQRRVLIPPTLKQYAGLEKEIVLVGALDRFEIWSKENYALEHEKHAEDLRDGEVRGEIAHLGL